jgi:mannosylglycerate hydrolase
VAISGYEAYVRSARAELRFAIPEHQGEMVDGRVTPVLRGINSTRMPLKQAYAAAEDALLAAEAVSSLAMLRAAARYPHAELEHAWRELLRNAPHDSVSGCSVDETHTAMAARFDTANQISARLKREAVSALAGSEARWSYREPVADAYSVINLLPWPRTEVVELRVPPGVAPADVQVAATRRDVAWALVDLPAFGATTIRLNGTGRESGSREEARAVGQRRLENGVVAVIVADDGTLTINDLVGGGSWRGAHEFEDVADRGDEYNFCPIAGDVPVTSIGKLSDCTVVESGPLIAELELRWDMELPRALGDDRTERSAKRTECRIITRVRVVAGSRRMEFRTEIDNGARDHRLRLLFPSGSQEPTVTVEGSFAMLERSARPTSDGVGWLEPPSATQHTRGLVAAGAIAIAGRGLPEYEAIEGADGLELALTLLRCVGWLSRDDLSTRPGGAGPSIEVPDAQCQGQHVFEYALWVGDADGTQRLRDAGEWRRPLVTGEAGVAHGSLLAVGGYGFADGSLKRAEDGDGLILRVFAGPDGGCIEVPADVELAQCRLDESPDPPGSADIGGAFLLPPARIASWRLKGRVD